MKQHRTIKQMCSGAHSITLKSKLVYYYTTFMLPELFSRRVQRDLKLF